MTSTLHRLYPPATVPEGPALWLIFRGDSAIVADPAQPAPIDGTTSAVEGFSPSASLLLGTIEGRACFAAELPADVELPAGFHTTSLRSVLAQSNAETGALFGYGSMLLAWDRTTRFCPACTGPLGSLENTWGRVCAACGYTIYPPVSPAIIVLIHEGDRALLTTKTGWGKRYSLVAGFVEPGETFEACVAREIREEVGVEIDQVRYVGSQPWPFPHQIMVGFLAHYAGGEIAIDTTELSDARWFSRDDMPEMPQPFTISRKIIDLWLSREENAVIQWS